MAKTFKGKDGKLRCQWSSITPEFIRYHDKEWGFPVDKDFVLFEKICLEGFQSGLSWRTVLSKRENFRKAFKNFDYNKVAKFTEKDINRLLKDEGIIRHRGKIEATINNARMARVAEKEFGSLASFLWSFEPSPSKPFKPQSVSNSEESKALSKELKKRGWKFVGPTTVYAFMQAMGLINDHSKKCVVRAKVTQARKKFKKPQVKSN